MKADIVWGNIARYLVILYVTLGGGYELWSGIKNGSVHSSFIFAFLSGLIFIGRIGYGITSGAKRTLPADIYGLTVMWAVAFLRLFLNGF